MFQAGHASPAAAVLAAPRLRAKQGVHETGVPNPLLEIVDSSSSTVRGRRGALILDTLGRHGPEGDSAVLHEEKRAERAHTRANTSSRPALRCAHITKITRNRNAAGAHSAVYGQNAANGEHSDACPSQGRVTSAGGPPCRPSSGSLEQKCSLVFQHTRHSPVEIERGGG